MRKTWWVGIFRIKIVNGIEVLLGVSSSLSLSSPVFFLWNASQRHVAPLSTPVIYWGKGWQTCRSISSMIYRFIPSVTSSPPTSDESHYKQKHRISIKKSWNLLRKGSNNQVTLSWTFCACLILVGYQNPDCSTFCFTPSFPSDKTCLVAFPGWSRLLMIAGKKSTNRRCQGSLSKHLMPHLGQPVEIVKTEMLFWAAYLALVLEASHPSIYSQKFVLLHLSLAAGSHTNRLDSSWVGQALHGPWLLFDVPIAAETQQAMPQLLWVVEDSSNWFSLSWIW